MVSRPSRSRRSARFFVKAIGWQVRLGYRYTEGSNQTPQRCRCVGGRIAIFLANLRPTSADKTDEAVVAASLLDSVLLKRPLRIREVDLLNET